MPLRGDALRHARHLGDVSAPVVQRPMAAGAVAAFIGIAPGGPIKSPTRISSWEQFADVFTDPDEATNGPFMEGAYLAHAVNGFFKNGGRACWVVRVGDGDDDTRSSLPQAALPAAADAAIDAYTVQALWSAEQVKLKVEVTEEHPSGGERLPTYRLVVDAGPEGREEFEGLTLTKGRANLATRINAASKLIKIEDSGGTLPQAQRAPATGTYSLSRPATSLTKAMRNVARAKSMGGLAAVDEVRLVCMPDVVQLAEAPDDSQLRDLQGKMIAHSEMAADRLAILDPPPGLLPREMVDWRVNTAAYDSKDAAMFYPWLEVMDPLTDQLITVPPSGHVAGVWSRLAAERGVHVTADREIIRGVERRLPLVSRQELATLREHGINCIRSVPARIYGATTLSSDPEWQCMNVRRLYHVTRDAETASA